MRLCFVIQNFIRNFTMYLSNIPYHAHHLEEDIDHSLSESSPRKGSSGGLGFQDQEKQLDLLRRYSSHIQFC